MAKLAIKGHATRGEEIIEILGMLGGSNAFNHSCDNSRAIYYIDEIYKNYVICAVNKRKSVNYAIFTLEEFLEKFPYKVGGRVRVPEYESEVRISKMYWDGSEVQYEVVTDEVEWYSAEELNEFNEPNKEKNDWAKWDLPDGYEFQDKEGNVINTDVIKLVKKQSLYPKTYEECCEVLGYSGNYNMILTTDVDNKLFEALYRLKVCRDAYWKIAGEQMGLGKPWKPDWSKADEKKYCIVNTEGDIKKWVQKTTNKILAFPTEEMRDTFYENFKDLINECKELL